MTQKRYFSAAERASIATMAETHTYSAVAARFNTTKSVVHRWHSRLHQNTTNTPLEDVMRTKNKSGRPRTYSIQTERRMARFIEKNDVLTPRQLVKSMEHIQRVSLWVIRSIMRDNGLQRFKRIAKPFLTKKHKKARLCYAKKHTNMDPKLIIATDESHLHLGYFNQLWVTAKHQDHLREDKLMPAFKKQAGFQIWAAVWYGGHSKLTRLDTSSSEGKKKGVTAKIYVDQILRAQLKPIWDRRQRAWRGYEGNPIILEDNAGIHTAGISKEAKKELGFVLLDHPANSPDLNPIENAWYYLKHLLDNHPARPRTVDELFALAYQLWDAIPQGYFNRFLMKLPERLAAVHFAQGGHINE